MRPLVCSFLFSGFGVGLACLYALLKRYCATRTARRQILRQFKKSIMGTNSRGGGVKGFFRRFWSCLTLYLIGIKWGIIEIVTRHRRLDLNRIPKRPGDVAVITGGARGIGAEVVKMLLRNQMHVIIGCRKVSAGTELVESIRQKDGVTGGRADVLSLDLMSLASVREFANQVLAKNIPINILINNAGIMFCPYEETMDGYESQFQTNYLSHFLLTNLLLPRIITSGRTEQYARIVNVSSCAHYGGRIDWNDLQMQKLYSPYNAYMVSKLLQVISSTDLNARFEKAGLKVNALSVHPGMVQTDLYQHLGWFKALHFFVTILFKNVVQGADTVAYAAISPEIEKQGGNFLANSQQWSPNPKVFDTALQKTLWNVSTELAGLQDINSNIDPNQTSGGSVKVSLN